MPNPIVQLLQGNGWQVGEQCQPSAGQARLLQLE